MAGVFLVLSGLIWTSLLLCQLCWSGYERANPPSTQSCYVRLDAAEGYMESPNFPDAYPSDRNCCYDIVRPSEEHCGVKLYAEQFDVAQAPGDNFCQTDWLAMESCVPEGGNRFCGNLTGTTYQYLFQPGSMALRFHFHSSKEQVSNVSGDSGDHVRRRYRTLTNCGGLFQEPSITPIPGSREMPCYTRISDKRGSINTPYYPKKYPENIDCVYEFVRPNPFICGIRMRSVEFQLEPSLQTPFGGACSDFFQAPGCGFLCGKLDFTWTARYQPGAVSSKFHFHSDEVESLSGFLITFEQVYHC